MFDNPKVALRALKGAPLSVLLALFVAPGPVDEAWLGMTTGYGVQTCRKACQYLEDIGTVQRQRRFGGWELSDGVFQLPLPLVFLGDGNGKNYRSVVSSSSSSSSSIKEEEEEAPQEMRANGKNYRSERENLPLAGAVDKVGDGLCLPGARELLAAAGTGEPLLSNLARRHYVTAEYVQGHLEAAAARGEPLRYALQRMKSGDGVPPLPVTAELADVGLDYCRACSMYPCHCGD